MCPLTSQGRPEGRPLRSFPPEGRPLRSFAPGRSPSVEADLQVRLLPPYLRYSVGTTAMFRIVELTSPHRITMAIGVWISLPDLPAPSASGMSASPAAIAVMRIGMSRSRAPRSTASRKSVIPSSAIRCWMSATTLPRSRPATLHETTIRRWTFSRSSMFGPCSRRTSASMRTGTMAPVGVSTGRSATRSKSAMFDASSFTSRSNVVPRSKMRPTVAPAKLLSRPHGLLQAHVDFRRFDALDVLVVLGASRSPGGRDDFRLREEDLLDAAPDLVGLGERRARQGVRLHGQAPLVELGKE